MEGLDTGRSGSPISS